MLTDHFIVRMSQLHYVIQVRIASFIYCFKILTCLVYCSIMHNVEGFNTVNRIISIEKDNTFCRLYLSYCHIEFTTSKIKIACAFCKRILVIKPEKSMHFQALQLIINKIRYYCTVSYVLLYNKCLFFTSVC